MPPRGRRILRWRRICGAPWWRLSCESPPWKLKRSSAQGVAQSTPRRGTESELEPQAEAGRHCPVGRKLHAVHVLVERQLDEPVGLQALRQHVAQPRAEEHEL